MNKEKEPMSMEEYADRITTKLSPEYAYYNGNYLWSIIFDAIQVFQDMQSEKELNAKERYQKIKLEKEREEER